MWGIGGEMHKTHCCAVSSFVFIIASLIFKVNAFDYLIYIIIIYFSYLICISCRMVTNIDISLCFWQFYAMIVQKQERRA